MRTYRHAGLGPYARLAHCIGHGCGACGHSSAHGRACPGGRAGMAETRRSQAPLRPSRKGTSAGGNQAQPLTVRAPGPGRLLPLSVVSDDTRRTHIGLRQCAGMSLDQSPAGVGKLSLERHQRCPAATGVTGLSGTVYQRPGRLERKRSADADHAGAGLRLRAYVASSRVPRRGRLICLSAVGHREAG
jgi:hypothetical protein